MIVIQYFFIAYQRASSSPKLNPSTNTLVGLVSSTLETKTHSDMQHNKEKPEIFTPVELLELTSLASVLIPEFNS